MPTRSGVLLMAAGAPLALLIGVLFPEAWILGLAWVPLVLVLLAMDVLLAAGSPGLAVRAPGAVEIGAPLVVHIAVEPRRGTPRALEVVLSAGPRLRPAGAGIVAVAPGEHEVSTAFVAVRRGPETIDRIWWRWAGPLGLMRRQRSEALELPVTVAPDIRPVRDNAALLLRDAQMGEMARIDRGEGSEFEALTEWKSGMERRTIDWKQSARHHMLLARETRIERNNQIVFAIDAGRVMCEPVAGLPRVDRAISAALLAAYAALKLGDKVSLFGFDSRPRVSSGAVSGTRAFAMFQRLAGSLDYSTAETNYTLALATLTGALNRRSLVIVFTEFTDQTGAELMIRAVGPMLATHLVLFVVLADEELESLTATEPETVDDISRAVTAAALLRERRIVISRLRQLGVHVLEARHDGVGPALVRQYLEFKRRNLL